MTTEELGERPRRFASAQFETARFLGLSLLVGVLVGAGAALLIWAVEWVGEGSSLLADRTGLGRWAILVSVPLGLLIAWWIGAKVAPEVAGDGVPEATIGLAVHAGYLPTRSIPLKLLATALTLGGGGSAGREGPIVQIGATIGSSVARRTGLGEDKIRSLVAAGAGAAIGASFNAPIAGMLFAMEVMLRTFSVRHLSAVVVASVAAAVTNKSLVGSGELLRAKSYGLIDPRELVLYAAIGLLAVMAGYGLLRMLSLTENLGERLAKRGWIRPIVAGLAVGGIGFFEPRILGTGQRFVAEVLDFALLGQELWWILFLLAVLKIIATSVTIGSGASGGAFMPSLFIGATLGAGFGELMAPIWNISPLRPGAFAVVGMAATFAAVARAPLTAILIVFEITQDYGLVLPLMLAVVLATLITDIIHPESVYTLPLAKRGIQLVRSSEVDVLDTVKVGDVMSLNPLTVPVGMPVSEVQAILDRGRRHGAAVLDEDDRLAGIVSINDVLRAHGPAESMSVAEVMTRRPVTVSPNTLVSMALERMAALGVGRLPVVSAEDASRLVGMFRREDAVRAYHRALGTSTSHELARDRLKRRTHPGAEFFDFRIPPGSMADGKFLREVSWPEGCTIVSVRRGRVVYVPTGNTRIVRDDVITAFSTPTARRAVIDRLNATGDEPTAEIPAIDGEEDEPS
ncbi:MAG: chloride channel protein [Acidimicrobiia bacterium]